MLRGWFPGLDGKQQCACACWMAVRTELHLKSLSASETRWQFGVFFFWQELTFFLLINKLNGEDCFPLQILATYFPLKIWTYRCQYLQYVSKRIFFCCFIEEPSGNKESRRWIVKVEAWIFICVFMSGEVWWMSVGTGTPGWTEHKRLFSRWVPGPKDEDTHLAEILSDSKTTES